MATNAGKGKEALLRWLNAFCARSYPHSVALLLAAKGNRKQREILPYVVDPIKVVQESSVREKRLDRVVII